MTSPALLRLAILIGILSVSAVARPCKTFFVSYSLSFNQQNPNPNDPYSSSQFLEIRGSMIDGRQFYHPSHVFISRRSFPVIDLSEPQMLQPEQPRSGRSFIPFTDDEISSLRDRTKDILGVVTSLLFGVGCGALTGAIMYFFWALFADRHNGYSVSFDNFEDGDCSDAEEDASPKKMGYAKIPAAESVPTPTKETA